MHCGYVVWLADADGAFHVVREEENYIDKAMAAKMPPEQVKAFARKYGC